MIGASLRPEDVMSKSLTSRLVKTNNVLLKITVPKRTGRKRKRDSTDPYVTDDASITNSENSHAQSAAGVSKVLLQTLRDNPNKYSIQPVGQVNETHRFRGKCSFYVVSRARF